MKVIRRVSLEAGGVLRISTPEAPLSATQLVEMARHLIDLGGAFLDEAQGDMAPRRRMGGRR